MAHHHLGHADQAQRCLQSAARWIAEADRQTSADSRYGQPVWGGFTERFEFPLLYAEAATLIGASNADAAAPHHSQHDQTPRADQPFASPTGN
jgi:hypothetical protein